MTKHAKFVLPEMKTSDLKDCCEAPSSSGLDKWDREIRVPANTALLKEMSIGDTAEVVLTGEIVRMKLVEGEDFDHTDFVIRISSVDVAGSDHNSDHESIADLLDEGE